jgi:hypothetical protein
VHDDPSACARHEVDRDLSAMAPLPAAFPPPPLVLGGGGASTGALRELLRPEALRAGDFVAALRDALIAFVPQEIFAPISLAISSTRTGLMTPPTGRRAFSTISVTAAERSAFWPVRQFRD